MNEKIPQPKTMTMLEFAEESKRGALLEHITNATETYERIGLNAESFIYNLSTKEVSLTLNPTKSHEGHEGLVQGGFLTNLIDASSGALGMTLVGTDEIAFTKTMNTSFHSPALSNSDIVASSYIDTEQPESKKHIHIITEVFQGEAMVASATVSMRSSPADILERIGRKR